MKALLLCLIRFYRKNIDVEPLVTRFDDIGRDVQATFWEIRPEMVRKVWKFRSRG